MELEPWHRGLRLQVAEDGYAIVSRRGVFGPKRESGEFLIPKSERFRNVPGIRADLYRTIAADALSRESIVALANKYGAIGRPVPTLPPRGGGETISAEPVQAWLDLWKLKLAVRLFDLIQQGDRMALESVIHVNAASGANLWIRREKDKMHLLPAARLEYGEAIFGTYEDVVDAALACVRQHINNKLTGVSPMVLYLETGEHKMVLRPATLEAALWLQFAEAVLRNKHREKCRYCKKEFEPIRSDQVFCSANCRIRAHRRTKLEQRRGGANQ